MILKSEISPKIFEILKKVKSRTGFFGVADPLITYTVAAYVTEIHPTSATL